jgi:outer membrane protein assembly factor BamB
MAHHRPTRSTGARTKLRRWAFVLRTALASSLSLACGSGRTDAQAPAATFRGDRAHTGAYAASGAPEFGGVLWRFRTEGPIRSSPAIADGRIYFGSGDGGVYCLGVDGRQVWRADAGSSVTSSPAVAGGRVYVQTRTGEVLALDARTGARVWRARTGPDAPFEWGFESGDTWVSSPSVANGSVLVGGGDGYLYAFGAGDGAVRWRMKTGGRVRSSPAVVGGVAYVGSADGSVYAVDVQTGAVRWRFDTLGRSLHSAEFGFDRRTVQSSPAVSGGTVYVGARDGILYAIDAATGRERWRNDHHVSWVNTSPAVAQGRVYAGSSDAQFVQAVDAATGRELWRAKADGIVWSSPALAGGTVYVGDGSGVLRALDAATGAERWAYRTGGRILGSPVPAAGMVVVGSEDGSLYAIRQGPPGGLRRVVFWDSAYARAAWIVNHEQVRDALAARGFQVQGAAALAAFLRQSVEGGTAGQSVVVFAIDHLADELAKPEGASPPLLRRYLDAGGKVVWIGPPPLVFPRSPATGDPGGITSIDRSRPQALLGVDFRAANFDPFGTTATAAGRDWGLHGWWPAAWTVAQQPGVEPLALDENGNAGAWVRRYGGRAGTGFVMIGRGAGRWTDFDALAAVADYRPGESTAGRWRDRAAAGSRGRRSLHS